MCDQAFEINSSPCRVHIRYIKHVTCLLQVTWCAAVSCTMSQCKLPARINSRFSFIIIVLIHSGVLIAIAYVGIKENENAKNSGACSTWF